MQVSGMGLDLKGRRLFPTVEAAVFTTELIDALTVNGERVRALTRAGAGAQVFRGGLEREVIDVGDVKAQGWTYLVNKDDPRRADIAAALTPLAKHRGMADPAAPLLFQNGDPDDWGTWLQDSYYALTLENKTVPKYILIVGGPDQVPFGFQSLLDSVASVGRVDFDSVDDLATYAKKVIRLEKLKEPVVTREAVVFAPDGGSADPTYYSRRFMAEPLADVMTNEFKLATTRILGDEATKGGLVTALAGAKPAIVYTASHGLGAAGEPYDIQTRFNGAICCQHQGGLTLDDLFSADDVPPDGQAFLEGSIFFQFACFGYGTPAVSEYAHWQTGNVEKNADHDFVAALPKRLLAHPKGPIAFIGHLDTAFLAGFDDEHAPEILERWHNRLAPFVGALRSLLQVQPSGLAMQPMNERYSTLNALLTNTYDRVQRDSMQWTPDSQTRFLDSWLLRGDAQNYMIFGDPAVSLALPES